CQLDLGSEPRFFTPFSGVHVKSMSVFGRSESIDPLRFWSSVAGRNGFTRRAETMLGTSWAEKPRKRLDTEPSPARLCQLQPASRSTRLCGRPRDSSADDVFAAAGPFWCSNGCCKPDAEACVLARLCARLNSECASVLRCKE